jgi:hypothetical protein
MKGHIIYMSLRAIQPGEEITVDYNFEYVGDQTSCACGASSCRTVMERMTPKLERELAKKKAVRAVSAGAARARRKETNGKVEPKVVASSKPKSKAAHI